MAEDLRTVSYAKAVRVKAPGDPEVCSVGDCLNLGSGACVECRWQMCGNHQQVAKNWSVLCFVCTECYLEAVHEEAAREEGAVSGTDSEHEGRPRLPTSTRAAREPDDSLLAPGALSAFHAKAVRVTAAGVPVVCSVGDCFNIGSLACVECAWHMCWNHQHEAKNRPSPCFVCTECYDPSVPQEAAKDEGGVSGTDSDREGGPRLPTSACKARPPAGSSPAPGALPAPRG